MISPLIPIWPAVAPYQFCMIFMLKLGYCKTFKPITPTMHLTVHYVLRLISVLGRAPIWSLERFACRQKKAVVKCHWTPSCNNVTWSNSCANLRASTYDRQRHISYVGGRIFAEYRFVHLRQNDQRHESINQQYVLNYIGIIALKEAQQELCQMLSERGLQFLSFWALFVNKKDDVKTPDSFNHFS